MTFSFAVGTLLIVRIPSIAREHADRDRPGAQFLRGFRFIAKRTPLIVNQGVILTVNFFETFGLSLVYVLVLSRTTADAVAVGSVRCAMGLGGLMGSLVQSTWGGPKRKIQAVSLGILFQMAGMFVLGLGSTPFVWSLGGFLFIFPLPIVKGCNTAIWQLKTPLAMQGRVFATRRFFAQISLPIAMLLSGPLVDGFAEPIMRDTGSAVCHAFRPLVGTGDGAGTAMVFVVSAACGTLTMLVAMALPVFRNIETLLPDQDENREE